jgi:hypothetical protein
MTKKSHRLVRLTMTAAVLILSGFPKVFVRPVEAQVTGYPDASNTGVPAGTVLTAYTGPSTIATAGTVITGKTIGCVQITASNVTIRNSRISCNGNAVVINDKDLFGLTAALIEDSEIDCQNSTGTGVMEAHFTLRRVEISRCENALSLNQDVSVEDSYLHNENSIGADPHEDGVQFGCGHWQPGFGGSSCASGYAPGALNITLRHNTIYGMTNGDTTFGTSAIITNPSGDTNILITNNLLAGGAYTLYCNRPGAATNMQVVNNHFSTLFSPKVGVYAPWTDCEDESVVTGNVYHETGQLLPGQTTTAQPPTAPVNLRLVQ